MPNLKKKKSSRVRKTRRSRQGKKKTLRKRRGGRAVPPTNNANRQNTIAQFNNGMNNNNANTNNNVSENVYYNIEQEWLDLYAHLDHNEIIDVRGFMMPRFYDWQSMGGELDLSFEASDLPELDQSHYDRVKYFFTLLSSQDDDIIQQFIENEFSSSN